MASWPHGNLAQRMAEIHATAKRHEANNDACSAEFRSLIKLSRSGEDGV
jgi:hypothetical protein